MFKIQPYKLLDYNVLVKLEKMFLNQMLPK